jgi:hypothetical protein
MQNPYGAASVPAQTDNSARGRARNCDAGHAKGYCLIDKHLHLWYCRRMQISPANPLKPLPAIAPPWPFLAISRKGSTKQWGLAVSSFAEPSAAQDFCANEISMADDLLQITAKTASRDVRLPTPPGGLMHLMNASER